MEGVVIPPPFLDVESAGPPPPPNALPPAASSYSTLASAALHPQLLVLYTYFAVIAWLLHKVIFKSVLADKLSPDRTRLPEVLTWTALAAVSLGSTWTHMLRYFARSYSDWLLRADLTSYGIPALPACAEATSWSTLVDPCHISLAATHFQRWSTWLSNTSLFAESWLLVVSNSANWWWSAEVCLFTVAAWAAFLQTQRRRLGIPHAWAYMALGQTVAVSFAASLFGLACALRALPDGSLVQKAVYRSYSDEASSRDSIVKEIEHGQEVTEPADGETGLVVTKASLKVVTHYVIDAPSSYPRLGSRLLLWTTTSLAAMTALRPNQSFAQVLTMHLLPIIPTLPSAWLKTATTWIEHHLLHPRPGSQDEEAHHASNARLKAALRPSTLFALFAGFGVTSKLLTTLALLRTVLSSVPIYEQVHYGRVKILLRLLYPTTFHSHPAQSSISSDAVCIALVTVAQILWDAVQLPARLNDRRKQVDSARPGVWTPAAIGLIALTPVLGPSTTFPAWLAVRENYLEKAEAADEDALRKEAGSHTAGLYVSEVTEQIVQTTRRAGEAAIVANVIQESGDSEGDNVAAPTPGRSTARQPRARGTRDSPLAVSESASPEPSPTLSSKRSSRKKTQ
ncbi:unnamed protein product [Parajaminaea phylloscopi]